MASCPLKCSSWTKNSSLEFCVHSLRSLEAICIQRWKELWPHPSPLGLPDRNMVITRAEEKQNSGNEKRALLLITVNARIRVSFPISPPPQIHLLVRLTKYSQAPRGPKKVSVVSGLCYFGKKYTFHLLKILRNRTGNYHRQNKRLWLTESRYFADDDWTRKKCPLSTLTAGE